MKVLMMMGVILAASSVLTGCSTSQGDLLPTGDAIMIAILHLIGHRMAVLLMHQITFHLVNNKLIPVQQKTR